MIVDGEEVDGGWLGGDGRKAGAGMRTKMESIRE